MSGGSCWRSSRLRRKSSGLFAKYASTSVGIGSGWAPRGEVHAPQTLGQLAPPAAVVDLHRAVQVALGLHLPEQPLEAHDAGVLADPVLLEDERVGARVPYHLAEAGEVDVDRTVGCNLGLSHRFVLPLFGARSRLRPPPAAAPTAPRPASAPCAARRRAGRAARRAGLRDRSPRD